MAKVLNEVKVKSGTYKKDGVDKISYQRIGSIIETKKGPMLKIDSIPVIENGWSGWAYLFEPRDHAPAKQSNDGFPDDDMDF